MATTAVANKSNDATGYITRPNFEEKFRSTKVQEVLYACINDVLSDKKFEQEACAEWVKTSKLQRAVASSRDQVLFLRPRTARRSLSPPFPDTSSPSRRRNRSVFEHAEH